MFITLRKKFLWGTQNGSYMASLQKPVATFIFNSALNSVIKLLVFLNMKLN